MFDQSNKSQLVPGITLNWVPMDDQYTPAKARENIELLLKRQIDIIMDPFGAENFLNFIDFVKSGSILVLFPISGVAGKRSPDLTSCIYHQPSAIDEGTALALYVAEKIKPKKVVLFYQDDTYGRALEAGAKQVLEKAKIPVTSISYQRNDLNFESAVEEIKKLNPDCIGLLATQQAAKILLQQLGEILIKKIQFFGTSELNQSMIRSYMQQHKVKCIVSNLVPDPLTSSLPIVQEFREDMDKANIPVDTYALDAYIGARLLIDVLKGIEGPVNKDSIIKAFERIKNYDFKGLQLNFDPMTRQLSNTIWLDTGAGDWITMSMAKKTKEKEPVAHVATQPEREEVVSVQAETIAIGSSMDMSKTDKTIGILVKKVLEAFFEMINREKTLEMRTVKIYVLDDEHNITKARANVQRLIKDYDVLALLMPMGSANVQGYLDLVNSGKIDVLFAQADSPALRDPDLKNLINFSASGLEVGYTMLKYACKMSTITKLVLFYEADVKGFLEGTKKALAEMQIKNSIDVPYTSSDVDYSVQAKKIKSESPRCDNVFIGNDYCSISFKVIGD